MRTLLKVGSGLLVLAFVLIGIFYGVLRANATPEGRTIRTETRPVGQQVRAVEVSGPIDLTLRYGATPTLEVRGEQRLLANVETSQEGDVLHIATRGIVLRHRQPLAVDLVLPALTGVTVGGSGNSSINGFSGERINLQLDGSGSVKFNGRFKRVDVTLYGSGDLDVNGGADIERADAELKGSGRVTLVGAARELSAEAAGSGQLDAQHLRADAVTLKQTGSGNSSVTARESVTVTLHGSGDVAVRGHPGERNVSRTGSGEVSYLD